MDEGSILGLRDHGRLCEASCQSRIERSSIEQSSSETQVWEDGLDIADLDNIGSLVKHRISENTRLSYRAQWNRFWEWAQQRGVQTFPARPEQVAAYLAGRMENEGHKPATLRASASAIGYVHRMYGLEDPCAALSVRGVLAGATRKMGRSQKQAGALTAEALEKIRSVAYERRKGRGGRQETVGEAKRRGGVDMAILSLMRDAMLRVSEAAALRWRDLKSLPDGTGRVFIRRSKTDQEGVGAVGFVSVPTMALLRAVRNGANSEDRIFGLRRKQMTNRIKRAAVAAGLGDGFSGHSPRIGMARDLARAGIEMTSLMNAGRWTTSAMPALYTRNERAARGAVAIYYGLRPGRAA